MLIRAFFVFLAVVGVSAVRAAPVLLVDANGILRGATGVLVGSQMYDVQFADGSCNSLFDNCNPSAFVFNNLSDANAASSAIAGLLYTQPPPFGILRDADTIGGCEAQALSRGPFPVSCDIYTPTAVSGTNLVLVSDVRLVDFNQLSLQTTNITRDFDTGQCSVCTYALWSSTPPTGGAPEPGTLALLAGSLLAAAAVRRRRKVA